MSHSSFLGKSETPEQALCHPATVLPLRCRASPTTPTLELGPSCLPPSPAPPSSHRSAGTPQSWSHMQREATPLSWPLCLSAQSFCASFLTFRKPHDVNFRHAFNISARWAEGEACARAMRWPCPWAWEGQQGGHVVEQRREGAGGACRGSRPELGGAMGSLNFITKEAGSQTV